MPYSFPAFFGQPPTDHKQQTTNRGEAIKKRACQVPKNPTNPDEAETIL
jgi:hypothetical protein